MADWRTCARRIQPAIALLGLVAGCFGVHKETEGDRATQGAEAAAEGGFALTVFGAANTAVLRQAFQDDEVMKELQRRTGVRLDFSPGLNVADPSVKLSVMLANKELPDIVIYNAMTDRSKVLAAKVAMPLDELVDKYGADIRRNAASAISISKANNSDDTHSLYVLPGGVGDVEFSPLTNDYAWNVRWDLYKALGYPPLATLDDLLTALGRMQQLEPTNRDRKRTYGLGLGLADASGHLMLDRAIANLQGFVQTSSNDAYLDMGTGKLVPRVSDPGSMFWKAMAFYNRAYRQGLLDPESATMKAVTLSEKYKTGRYLAAPSYTLLGGADSVFQSNGDTEKGFVPFLVDANPERIFAGQSTYNGNTYELFIPKTSKHAEAAMKVVNYLYSYEGAELLLNGVEGKHYDMVGGVPVVRASELEGRRNDPNYMLRTGIGKYAGLIRFSPLNDPHGYPAKFDNVPETLQRILTPAQRDFKAHYGYRTVTEPFTRVPTYVFDTSVIANLSAKPGSDVQAQEQQLNAYLIANVARVIFQRSDSEFAAAKAKFLEEYKAKGAAAVFAYYETKYKEALAAIGP
ncbi:MAG: extracellular solute-binding protein [Paenibacillaceae bacterium]|nr:extracellular solute-binding protein [Paenibacillaceae bacterium]